MGSVAGVSWRVDVSPDVVDVVAVDRKADAKVAAEAAALAPKDGRAGDAEAAMSPGSSCV